MTSHAVIAEIAVLHDTYEHALAANDVAALTRFFWDSPDVVRYGVVEHLYGAEQIKAYRVANVPSSSRTGSCSSGRSRPSAPTSPP